MFAKFGQEKVSQGMIDTIKQVTENKQEGHEDEAEDKALCTDIAKKEVKKHEKKMHNEESIEEVAPPGFKGTVKAMKKHKDITNPFALAWSMKKKGYKSHIKSESVDTEIEEELKGGQVKLDKNKNGKLDADDFKKLRKEENIDEATPAKNTDVADKSWLKDAGKKPGPLHNVGKGLKAFLKGKPEPMESVEIAGEQLDEVSSKTLKSYIKGAKASKHLEADAVRVAQYKDNHAWASDATQVMNKRREGIKKAKEKLNAEEVEQIDELSLDTLKSAAKKNAEKAWDYHMDDNKHWARVSAQRALRLKAKIARKERQLGEAKRPEDDSVPFAPPYETTNKDVVTDKSGAQHTPMSRAKDLARTAMKRIKSEMLGKAPGNN